MATYINDIVTNYLQLVEIVNDVYSILFAISIPNLPARKIKENLPYLNSYIKFADFVINKNSKRN